MQVIRNAASPHLDPEIRALIQRRIDELGPDADLATFIVVEPGDGLDLIDAQLGFPLLSNRVDGKRFGEPDFTPCIDVLEAHPGCYELVFVLGDDGAGVFLVIPKVDGIDPELLSFCASFANPTPQLF